MCVIMNSNPSVFGILKSNWEMRVSSGSNARTRVRIGAQIGNQTNEWPKTLLPGLDEVQHSTEEAAEGEEPEGEEEQEEEEEVAWSRWCSCW